MLRLLPFLRYSGSMLLYADAGSSVISTTTHRRKQGQRPMASTKRVIPAGRRTLNQKNVFWR